jgi:YegS/Rv2252/BmrU family lipid kinase
MRCLVIINPIAGPGRRGSTEACAELARSILGSRYAVEARVTDGPRDAHGFASAALSAGVDLVVAWGGDGTVNGAASALAGTDVPLAIVPAGSGNGLARDLSIPLEPRGALGVALTTGERSIDAGVLDGSMFFNVAGIGLDARIAQRLASAGHRRGLPGYVQATMAELRRPTADRYSIRDLRDPSGQSSGVDIGEQPVLFVALANSRQYGNGAQIAPSARLDDGAIEIVVVQEQPLWRILRQVPSFFRGTLREGPGLLMRRAASATILGVHPIRFHVDGEPRSGPNHLVLGTRPGALKVKANR